MRSHGLLALTASLVLLLTVTAACAPRSVSQQKPSTTTTTSSAPPGVRLQAESPAEGTVGAEFGGRLQLVSYRLSTATPGPGDGLDVELSWKALGPITDEHRAFLELVDEQGEELAGDDDIIGGRQNPTSGWAAGAEGTHRPGLTIPRQFEPGRFELRVGVLQPDRKTRLPLTVPAGLNSGENWVTIAVFRPQ